MISSRALDIISTIYGFKQINDNRIKEYGLDKYFIEGNPYYSRHPSSSELLYKESRNIPALYIISMIWPAIGRGMLFGTIHIAENNYKAGFTIKYSIELGDKVKEMLHHKKEEHEIKGYLKKLNYYPFPKS